MALSYDDWKNQWEGMTDVQRARVSQSMKDNATFQDYGKRYVQEQKGMNINPTGYQNNTQNTGSTVSNNQNGGTNNVEGTNTQPTVETPQNETNNTEPTQGTEGNGGKYGKTEFDPEETLQEDKFGQDPGKITIYEGTGKDTGRPDYEIETQDRLDEMAGNLDHYYATQPKLFTDRKTFNEFFQYNDRPSDQQRALLDSYWQKKQDENKAKSYTSGDALAADLNSGNMTQDVWNQVMEGNQKAYIEWQERMKNELELAIANFAAPFNPDTLADTLQSLVNKLGIQAGDPYDIIGGWENKMQELGAYQSLHELDSTVNQLKSVASQRQNIINRYASSAGGTQSDALVAARLNKALAPYDQQFSDLYTLYQTQHTTYQTKLGTANQYAQVMYQQAQEDQRIFNNKIKSLGFAMEVNSYRTPEQQAQLGLQVQSIQNDMSLLNKAKQNDLELYNKRQQNQLELQHMYDTAEMQNAINLDMTDLTVENEGQLRANLNNVLSQYYAKFGDIIERPQQLAVDDIIAYAKEKGISVAQALKENFLDKLQEKEEYKNYLASNYAAPDRTSKYQPSYKATVDKDGNLTWTFEGYGDQWKDIDFTNITDRKGVQDAISKISESVSNPEDFVLALSELYPEGTYGGQCGAFMNDILEKAFGDTSVHFGNDFWTEKYKYKNKEATETPKAGDIALISRSNNSYGHVMMVTGVDSDGNVSTIDSNGQVVKGDDGKYHGTEKIRKKTYTADEWARLIKGTGSNKLEGFYESPSIENSNPMAGFFNHATENAKGATKEERQTISSAKFIYDSFYKMKENGEMEKLIEDSFQKDLFSTLVTKKFSEEKDGGQSFFNDLTRTLQTEVIHGEIDEMTKAAILNVARAVEVKLRHDSGAAISASEWANNFFDYMPGQGKGLRADIEALQAWDGVLESWAGGWGNKGEKYMPLFDRSYIYGIINGYNTTSDLSINEDDLPAGAKKSSTWYNPLTWF